ncbi:MAG TPA: energy transducer TonB [Thermoanaerobaculia bacterium]
MNGYRGLPVLLLILLVGCSSSSPSGSVAVDSYAAIPKYEKGGPITPPRVIKRVEPVISRALRETTRAADAEIEAVIDEKGTVIGAVYLSGNREWAQALAYAVGRWRFEPATLDGKPIAVRFTISSTFRRN